MAPQAGLEPAASSLGMRCSSDRAAAAWRREVGSNHQPPASEAGALPIGLSRHGLEGWIRTIVAGSVDRHPSVRRPREMDPAAGVGPASPPWQGGVVAVGQREDGTDDRNRTRLDWFWKPAPTQSATSVENDLLRPKPPWGTRPSRVARPAARKYRRRSRRCRWRRAQDLHLQIPGCPRSLVSNQVPSLIGEALQIWRKVRESNPQGSSLGGFRDRCRRPSACPSRWWSAEDSSLPLSVKSRRHRHLCLRSA